MDFNLRSNLVIFECCSQFRLNNSYVTTVTFGHFNSPKAKCAADKDQNDVILFNQVANHDLHASTS